MDSMLAASLTSPGTLTLDRRPLPALGPRDALLTVEATTLCGTDPVSYTHLTLPTT